MRILVADDDPTLRSELAELLRTDGHQVQAAADGVEALRHLEAEAYDVALLDLVMPGATGLEILHRLHVNRREVSVVMITGHGSVDVAVEAMKAGAADFVVKPFELDSLEHVLDAIQMERQARELLATSQNGSEALRAFMEEAARRKALLAIVGPEAPIPVGAVRTLRIDETSCPPDGFTPSELHRLNTTVESELADLSRPVVYASGLGLLEAVHGRSDFKAWVKHIGGLCSARGGTLVLARLPAELATELDAELGAARQDASLQGLLESLANPIRRAIVSYVFASGPVSYSAILKMNFVDSSSKLSFHLQKLQSDHLLAKVEGGAYALTEEGRRAWRVVRALERQGEPPSVLIDSS